MPAVCKTLFILLAGVASISGCSNDESLAAPPPPCSGAWNDYVETRLTTGDGMGHGPDIGSDEWQSVVEFKLGLRDHADVPDRASKQWCIYIDQQIGQ
jgi:hypothetical protein